MRKLQNIIAMLHLFITYFIWCTTRYTMRQTCVSHKATRCTKLRGTQHSAELALRSTDFRALENLIFPALKPHSSPWFSAAYAAAIVHKNHFFCLYQQNKSSKFKVTFRQASNCCKRVLEAAKLYGNKTKEPITSQKHVLNKGKSATPPLFNGQEVIFCIS